MDIEASIIILNWNGQAYLKDCLTAVLGQKGCSYKVLVVDNNSSDNSIVIIKNFHKDKRVELLRLEQNVGYAKGNNAGFEYCKKKWSPKYMVTLNNDTVVDQYWLKNLLNGFSENDIGITTSKILLKYRYTKVVLETNTGNAIEKIIVAEDEVKNYRVVVEAHDKKREIFDEGYSIKRTEKYSLLIPLISKQNHVAIHFKRAFSGRINGEQISNKIEYILSPEKRNLIDLIQNAGSTLDRKHLFFRDNNYLETNRALGDKIVDAGCGAAMAIKSEIYDKCGGFNPEYGSYNEDSELSWRYSLAGYKTKYIEKALVRHYLWGSSAVFAESKIYLGVKNRLLFIKKYFGKAKFFYYWCRTIARMIYFLFVDRRYVRGYYKAILRALKSS